LTQPGPSGLTTFERSEASTDGFLTHHNSVLGYNAV
jgi:hypothetical protein